MTSPVFLNIHNNNNSAEESLATNVGYTFDLSFYIFLNKQIALLFLCLIKWIDSAYGPFKTADSTLSEALLIIL